METDGCSKVDLACAAARHSATCELAVAAALAALRRAPLLSSAKQAVKEEVLKPQNSAPQSPAAILERLRALGLDVDIKRFAYEELRQLRRRHNNVERLSAPGFPLPPLPVQLDSASTLDAVEFARSRWAYLTLARLRERSKAQGQPFLRPRARPRAEAGWEDESDEVTTRQIVDLASLYRLLTKEMPRPSTGGGVASQSMRWSVLGVEFRTLSLEALRERFRELSRPGEEHLGVAAQRGVAGSAERAQRAAEGEAELMERRLQEAQALLKRPYPPHLHLHARRGVAPSCRRGLWAACLGPACGEVGAEALQDLAREVGDWEWITDDALRLDVAEHSANDACYFPFDEIVEGMVLTLSRDASVAESCECGAPQLPVVAGRALAPGQEAPGCRPAGFVPPCGVVPFQGLSCYACPFAFLADRLETAYPLFRAFYCRYLSRLHTISCQPTTLLPLCALFESLVFSRVPDVAYHLLQLGPDAAPLRVAFPWIVRGFVGYLRIDQVLYLWDRVLGY